MPTIRLRPEATHGDESPTNGSVTAGGCGRVEALLEIASSRCDGFKVLGCGRSESPRVATTIGTPFKPPCRFPCLALGESQPVQIERSPRLHTGLGGKPLLYPARCLLAESAIPVEYQQHRSSVLL